MISLIQKFNCTSTNCDILHLPEVLDGIKQLCGEKSNLYQNLINYKAIELEISAILCNSPTKIEARYRSNKPTFAQDCDELPFSFPENVIAQIISTNQVSGTIFLTMR